MDTASAANPHALDPTRPGFFDSPYAQYREARENSPVHRTDFGPWMVFGYDDVVRVLRDQTLSVDDRNAEISQRSEEFIRELGDREPRGRKAILNMDPPDHTRIRRLVQKAFTPRTVDQLADRVQELVDEALDAVENTGTMDVIADLAFPLPFTVISETLGMPDGDTDELRAWSHTLAGTLDPIVDAEAIRAAMEASDLMSSHVEEVVAWKRRQPADDLLSALLAAEDDGDVLSPEELREQVVLLYIAGHETTVNLIGNATFALLRNRSQLRRWHDDPDLGVNAVEELLRYDSPVQFSRRIATTEIEVGGVRIPERSFVLTCLGSANHDPARFGPDAEELRLDRESAPHHVSFGNGIHHCLGAALARLEGRLALGTLVRRFPDMTLATDTPRWNGRFVLRGLDALPVALH
ncbi:MAG: cytochrome P450 [Acidimicrobiia bacterium]|nr:cytochrome P450 [Acidimicrobiia bacterium]